MFFIPHVWQNKLTIEMEASFNGKMCNTSFATQTIAIALGFFKFYL